MKAKYIIFLLFFVLLTTRAYSQNWLWAKSNGGDSLDRVDIQMLCIDNNGSSYYCGNFSSNPCYFSTDTLIPNGIYDLFIAKYDASGNEQWVKSFGGNNTTQMQQEKILSICYNENANKILLSGYFYGMIVLGNDTLYGSPSGGFKACMDTSGNFNWVKQDAALIATEGDGYFYGEVTYRIPGMIDTILVTPGVWLTKYTVQGDILWARKIFNYSGSDFDAVLAKFQVKSGRVFGFGSCHRDTFTVDTIEVHANFPSDQYIIVCFDTSSSALWVKPTSGRNPHNYSDIEVDDDLNSYISGPFTAPGIFDLDTLQSGGNFIAKYDSGGVFKWVNFVPNITLCWELALDNEHTIYAAVVGHDTSTICNDTIVASSLSNMLIVRFDSSGTCISWMLFPDSSGVSAMVCDSDNNLIIAGGFCTILNLGNNTLNCLGVYDTYIAKSSALTGTGGEEDRRINQLIIFANPNKGTCNITIPDEFKHEKKLTLSIYDNSGKLIQYGSLEMNEERVRINLEAEAKGIYNVTLSNGKKSYAGKIVFE